MWLGEPSDSEEGGEGDPHQHSFLDVRFPGTPERDYSQIENVHLGRLSLTPDTLVTSE